MGLQLSSTLHPATYARLRHLLRRVQLASGREPAQILMLAEFGWNWAKAGIMLGFTIGVTFGFLFGLAL